MILTFDDIISKKHLNPFPEDISGLGKVNIHPLSAHEAFECINKYNELQGEELEVYLAERCCRMLKGKEATNKEVKLFRKNNTVGVIREIYFKGLSGNGESENSEEQIEKN